MATMELQADRDGPYTMLSAKEAFEQLSDNEKLYAHFMSRAGFHGTRILLGQLSEEATGIFELIMEISQQIKGNWSRLQPEVSITASEARDFLDYAAMFLANIGNFRSNGYRKFIPRIQPDALARICGISSSTSTRFTKLRDKIYSESPDMIGHPGENDQSTFYVSAFPITEDEILMVDKVLSSRGISNRNTRIEKLKDHGCDQFQFHVLIASSEIRDPQVVSAEGEPRVVLKYGDFSGPLAQVVEDIKQAKKYAQSEAQHQMLDTLIESFQTGDMNVFHTHHELWVQDLEPAVEISHGFIETYQDPYGVRGSWQGFVGITNRPASKAYKMLCDKALDFLYELPWNKVAMDLTGQAIYETPVFHKPSFVNFDVLSHATAEIVAGINLPNDEDIRQKVGLKNLTLGNANKDPNLDVNPPFLRQEDHELFGKYRARAFDVINAGHELLGHGSGRLFMETKSGELNFDTTRPPVDLLTTKPIECWYKYGQTFHSVFAKNATSFEECRADGVALLLVAHKPVLEVFGYHAHSNITPDDITYIGWLQFLQGALKGMATWNPTTRRWGHAQKQGQYVILRSLVEGAPDLLTLEETGDRIAINLDRTKITSLGVSIVSKLLLRLQVYRSTGNAQTGGAWYEGLSEMTESFLRVREIVKKHRPNRTKWIQANTRLIDGKVTLVEYPASAEGLIQSWTDREI